jgi:hypothetical protein
MRVTIIPVDGFVSVDGEGYSELDLSFMASDIHALQWYETDGEIERKDNRGRVIANEKITDLTPYQPALDAWQAAKTEAEQAVTQTQAPEPEQG